MMVGDAAWNRMMAEIRKLGDAINAHPGSANGWSRGRKAENRIITKMQRIQKLMIARGENKIIVTYGAVADIADEARVQLKPLWAKGGYSGQRADYVDKCLHVIQKAAGQGDSATIDREARWIINGLTSSTLGALP